MEHVLTLIAAPGSGALDAVPLDRLRRALSAEGAAAGEVTRLAEEAIEITLEAADPAAAEAAAHRHCSGLPVDLAVQPAEGRRKRILVADMESTIVEQEMLDELADIARLGPAIAEVTARAMRGELEFTQALAARAALLQGLPAEILQQARERITLSPGARTLVSTMRAHGARTALVTGGFDVFARPVADACGFHEVHANHLVISHGTISGTVARPMLSGRDKLRTLETLAREQEVPRSAVAAVGDGANDVPMLQAAGLGVAYRAKPAVVAATRVRLDNADLTGLLYLQGYRRDELSV
jgi:phosphoserine phosphatase